MRPDGQPYEDAYLSLQPGAGFPMHRSDGGYTINLFKGMRYEITANSYCLLEGGGMSRAKVSVRTEDDSENEVTLVMPD